MKILVLTDHTAHTASNSVYGLVNALKAKSAVDSIAIASRGLSENAAFFNGTLGAPLYGESLKDDVVFPRAWDKSDMNEIVLLDYDILFLRLPRPIHPDFFESLESAFPSERIINRPSGIRKTSNKLFLLSLDHFVEPMAMINSVENLKEFTAKNDCVLKPIEAYGGQGIIKIKDNLVHDGDRLISLNDYVKEYEYQPKTYLAMKYMNNVANGDKRIVVAGGEILTASLRTPVEGGWLCNVAQGGRDEISEVTDIEKEIVDYLTPILRNEGIFYYGLDTLENDDGDRIISEINTLSIGGLSPYELLSGSDTTARFATLFIEFAKSVL